jgi:hypothetical protein
MLVLVLVLVRVVVVLGGWARGGVRPVWCGCYE